MILETQEEQIRYVTHYLQNRFEVLTEENRLGDATAIYQELVCDDYDGDTDVDEVFLDQSWLFLVVEAV